ncbi:MAG: hypothetical protein Q9211_003053, partial [Gyalolechia sp. 1 TL-2023]
MNFSLTCIGTYLLLVLPIPIATLVLPPQTNASEMTGRATLSGIAIADGRIGLNAPLPPSLTDWCRPPASAFDLHFTTQGGKRIGYREVVWVVGVLRELTAKAVGKDARIVHKSLMAKVDKLVITIFDEKLGDRTWAEVHEALDILLVCVYMKKIASEFHGILFEVSTWMRFAAIRVMIAAQPSGLGEGNATK